MVVVKVLVWHVTDKNTHLKTKCAAKKFDSNTYIDNMIDF